MDDSDKLYSLKLHEGFVTSFGIFIMRVPDGWIYDCWDMKNDLFKIGIFVPFSDKFQVIKKNPKECKVKSLWKNWNYLQLKKELNN